MASTMLKTGEVAEMLGVSRQHVVNLCDSARLEHSLVGSHRRISRSAVESMLSRPLTEEREKSLWLHRAVLGELVQDPEGTIEIARANLASARARHARASAYIDGWEKVLDGGVDEIAKVLVGRDEWSCELRQNTPFAGVLSEQVRQSVLRSFRMSRGR